MEPRCLTIGEAAQVLKIPAATLYTRRWRTRVGLPTVKFGGSLRVLEHDLVAFLARHREGRPGSAPKES
jgi:hypothetical protein